MIVNEEYRPKWRGGQGGTASAGGERPASAPLAAVSEFVGSGTLLPCGLCGGESVVSLAPAGARSAPDTRNVCVSITSAEIVALLYRE